ncbi:hypothetical protein Scep_020220 [Stephania cephalantha]|uniref:Uncharacterized protein n=1 Tax=Stephania cephalantha TaxID=152367 RepID=A0AAP0IC80_9MAGN
MTCILSPDCLLNKHHTLQSPLKERQTHTILGSKIIQFHFSWEVLPHLIFFQLKTLLKVDNVGTVGPRPTAIASLLMFLEMHICTPPFAWFWAYYFCCQG